MAETLRVPGWLKVGLVVALAITALWFWLNTAFRAPDVIPVLEQAQSASEPSAVAPEFKLLSEKDHGSQVSNATDLRTNNAATPIEIDCSSPELAKQQMSSWIDNSFGAELTELMLSGAMSWADKNPTTLRESFAAPDGLEVPAGYASYTDDMLQAAAENGDSLAAAILGAKLVKAAQMNFFEREPQALRASLARAEHYLQQGIQANISGTLQFFWRAAELQATRSRSTEDHSKSDFTDRDAVIETHARTLLNQLHGSFEERINAHMMLAIPKMLPPLTSDDERRQVLDRAKVLAGQFAGITQRSKEERRAENAVVALLTVGLKHADTLDNMRCSDGRTLAEVLPEDAFDDLANRYGFVE